MATTSTMNKGTSMRNNKLKTSNTTTTTTTTTTSSSFCLPSFNINNINKTNKKNFSPMTLLERFREAVFRLIMLSALSKPTTSDHKSTSVDHQYQRHRSVYHHHPSFDPHHNEAVADCIEFIKKKSAVEENHGRDSTASSVNVIIM
ncbi:hypothetical protein ACFE04_023877 [Oxalis oulophora]